MITPVLLGVFSFLFFLLYQVTGIYAGDSGDLVTAACTFGVPHPPGYPLYTLLGKLLCLLPISTPSFRVTFLSSIPHALVIVIVYLAILKLTKHTLSALFGSLVLLGNYLFFLYSVTPEVFALFDLFVVVIVYVSIRFLEKPTRSLLYILVFVFSLSLSHHHVILFIIPSLLYVLWVKRETIGSWFFRIQDAFSFFLVFLLGLFPYLYIPVAARQGSMVNWDRAVDLPSFIHLILRKDYGTFISNGIYGQLFYQRILQIKAYGEMILFDFTWIGIVLAVIGFIAIYTLHRRLFVLFFSALLFLGPLFLFYASFPLMNRFTLGTYERFLLPSYCIFSVLVGIGYHSVLRMSKWISARYFDHTVLRHLSIFLSCILFLYPLLFIYKTSNIFYGFAQDKIAENLGIDILSTVPLNATIIISRDTALFSTQYVRYALRFRPDIALLHLARFGSREYFLDIQKNFPGRIYPQGLNQQELKDYFLHEASIGSLYSNTRFTIPEELYWVQQGLLYQLLDKRHLPQVDILEKSNDELFSTYHSPLSGILLRYNHLMLSDVKSVYAGSYIEYGKILLKIGKVQKSEQIFRKAVALGSDIDGEDAYTYLGLSLLFQKHCSEALSAFESARNIHVTSDNILNLYESVTHGDCASDQIKAGDLLKKYEAGKIKTDIELQSL
ncbi:MAG: DUF2723 domain-containing protein [Patescibacteria group bacterium]